ncbi:MAG: MFS transporter [Acidimicrobiaceae bacterium]|nr:MFS transporter [Acidimicrobiaceae bacterium]
MSVKRSLATDLVCLGSFVVLGLPDGMLGTAWPSMRRAFGAPVADLGLVLVVTTAGAVGVSVFVGRLIRRLGVPTLLGIAAACGALGAAGFALAPGLWLVLAVAVLVGAAAGMMDGGLNTAVGLSGRSRLLNLLHGAYGVGTALGPLLVTVAIVIGSWRPAYLALVVSDLVIALLWLFLRQPQPDTGSRPTGPRDEELVGQHPSDHWSRRRATWVLVAGMAIFFVYTGLEVAAGQWEASFGRGRLGLSPASAGLATFGYWAALTATRFGLALIPRPPKPQLIVRWGAVAAIVATLAIWWQPDLGVTLSGFVVLGAALAGLFPALIALTPSRIGGMRAQHAIAWQVGAAAAGGSAISAVIGLLIGTSGYAVLGPSLAVLALLLMTGTVILGRVAPPADVKAESESVVVL